MKRGYRRLAATISLAAMAFMLAGCGDKMGVLNPKGAVGKEQLDLIIISTVLCLIVVVPTLVMAFWIAWKYRIKRKQKTDYQPEWSHNTKAEAFMWGIPLVVIIALASITAHYTYKLEPSKPLKAEAEPITIQVASLDWKWLFLYPEQGIATVNYLQFPDNVPVRFELTSDAPMNSFWIPQLGGQIYTMSGMKMKLHLIADEPGEYFGSGANFSGEHFGAMRFVAKATSQDEFDKWVQEVKNSSPALTKEGYDKLALPGVSDKQFFSSFPDGLFDWIVVKYGSGGHGGHADSSSEKGESHGHSEHSEAMVRTATASEEHAHHHD
ncbi:MULTISPECIES: ubiquinol oxidase subunit II [Cohnella]|jgi:cytochrome o ubiquinol oxidase subunit 2|uniref:ubiquinol oxidase subunit II n=1 Tax=Cohnella TaxID=329857 RepID=UPI00036885E7|nr:MULTISPECIES: ubiquinol oxidase subunit II [Cohnella]REK66588.1 MAG: ubiquinol oxidase subunit II [Cohnella sp.]